MKRFALVSSLLIGCSSSPLQMSSSGPPWLLQASILTQGEGVTNTDCRTGICQHNENTDLIRFDGAIYLVHRTARSQVLGPDSSLHVYRSSDEGESFTDIATLPAPTDRDLRDPHFYIVGNELHLKALTRLPVTSQRDSNVDTIAVGFSSTDGSNWNSLGAIGPETWSFWRIQENQGVYYSAAYEDGDQAVKLFSSTDGVSWTAGADVYTVSADTPLETELQLLADGTLLALVRMDGSDAELLGDMGRLRTNVCVASPPYTSFSCPMQIMGERFDGPLAFQWQGRLFVVARKHLQPTLQKRTALYELTGDFAAGQLSVKEWGELPSAGDTSYAGQVMLDDHRVLLSWYSGDVARDENWVIGMLGETDIWTGVVDLSLLR